MNIKFVDYPKPSNKLVEGLYSSTRKEILKKIWFTNITQGFRSYHHQTNGGINDLPKM